MNDAEQGAKFTVVSYSQRPLWGYELEAARSLHDLRCMLYRQGLIGFDGTDHYGNVSSVLNRGSKPSDWRWLVSCTKTSGIDPETYKGDPLQLYAVASKWNPDEFTVHVEGPGEITREAPSHFAVSLARLNDTVTAHGHLLRLQALSSLKEADPMLYKERIEHIAQHLEIPLLEGPYGSKHLYNNIKQAFAHELVDAHCGAFGAVDHWPGVFGFGYYDCDARSELDGVLQLMEERWEEIHRLLPE